jgi:hypothetical protein
MSPLRQLAQLISPLCAVAIMTLLAPRLESHDKMDAVQYGACLIISAPAPDVEVAQAFEEVVQNGIIRGSKEYNKDEYISGAAAASDRRWPITA